MGYGLGFTIFTPLFGMQLTRFVCSWKFVVCVARFNIVKFIIYRFADNVLRSVNVSIRSTSTALLQFVHFLQK